MKPAEDARIVDTTGLEIELVVDYVQRLIQQCLPIDRV